MTRKIIVTIQAKPDQTGSLREELQILTKHDVFKVPIEATIPDEEEFAETQKQALALKGKDIKSSRVRERLNQSVQKAKDM